MFTDVSEERTASISRFKCKPNKFPAVATLLAGCFLDLFFDPEDGGNAFLRNVGEIFP
jgi:hypothetical protein